MLRKEARALDSEFNNNVVGLMIWNEVDNDRIYIASSRFEDNDKWGVLMWGNTLTEVLIEKCKVLNNDGLGLGYYGIDFYTNDGLMTDVAVHLSTISGHTVGGGLKNCNTVTTAVVDATQNWWGDASGPYHLSTNPSGTGDGVTDYVDYDPWIEMIQFDSSSDLTVSPSNDASLTVRLLDSDGGGVEDAEIKFSSDVGLSLSSETATTDSSGYATITASGSTIGVYFVTASFCGMLEDIWTLVVVDKKGMVAGGGWIGSEAGAYKPEPGLAGKANFGFVSKYKKGASVPTGQTEFQVRTADLNFHSTSYDWMVIAGWKAIYKGTGTINGEGEYRFILSAIDGRLNGNNIADKFRIKIWTEPDSAEIVIYDNQLTGDTGEDADPTTDIAGGNIIIKKK